MTLADLNPEFGKSRQVSLLIGQPVIEICPVGDEDFFSERADQSEVKARIVSKYFPSWARIIAPRTMHTDGKLAYIDLFAGPSKANRSATWPCSNSWIA